MKNQFAELDKQKPIKKTALSKSNEKASKRSDLALRRQQESLIFLTQQLLESHSDIKANLVGASLHEGCCNLCKKFAAHQSFDRARTWNQFSIIILSIAGFEVMYQLGESVCSYCLFSAKTLRRQSHTHIRAHTCTPSVTLGVTVSHTLAVRRILAQTWWYLWRW